MRAPTHSPGTRQVLEGRGGTDVLLIARHDLRRSVRSRQLAWLGAAFVLLTCFVVWVGVRLSNRLEGWAAEIMTDAEVTPHQALYLMLGWDPDQATYWAGIPVAVVLLLVASRFLLPWLAVFLGFDRIGADVQTGAARFVVVRAGRSSLVLGRFLAAATVLVGLMVATHLMVLGASILATDGFDPGRGALLVARYGVLVLPVGLVWLALTCWLSSLLRPALALLGGVGLLVALAVAGGVVGTFGALAPLRWLLPGTYAELLLSHRGVLQLAGAGALTAFAAVLLAAASWTFARRDL